MRTAIVLYKFFGLIPAYRVLRFYEESDLQDRLSCVPGTIVTIYEGVRYLGI